MDAQRKVLVSYLVRQLYALRLAQFAVPAVDQQHQSRWLEKGDFELVFVDMQSWRQHYNVSHALAHAAESMSTNYVLFEEMSRDLFEAWYTGMKKQIRQIARDTFHLNQDS